MITKQAADYAHARAAQTVLSHYGLVKGAGVVSAFGKSLQSAGNAFGGAMRAGNYGNAIGDAWKGLGSQGRTAMRGIGAGLTLAGGAYLANKAFSQPRGPYGY